MALLTLRPNWPAAEFRRTLTGEHGETIKKLVFPKGLPVEVGDDLLPLLARELAAEALVPCAVDEKGRLRLLYPAPPSKERAAAPAEVPPSAPLPAEAATDAPPADEPEAKAESGKRKAESGKRKADK